MQVMVLFSIHPVDKGAHVGAYVARAVQVIRDSGLEHELGPSGTTILGEWDAVFACIKACHEALAKDCHRLSSLVKVDQAAFTAGAIQRKVRSVEDRLAAPPSRSKARSSAPRGAQPRGRKKRRGS